MSYAAGGNALFFLRLPPVASSDPLLQRSLLRSREEEMQGGYAAPGREDATFANGISAPVSPNDRVLRRSKKLRTRSRLRN
jgi:hypothetical protein